MSAEEFWHGDVWLVKAYRKAHKLKIEEANHLAWLQGLYVYQAVGTVAVKLTSKKKAEYLEKPLELFRKEKAETIAKAKAEDQAKLQTDAVKALLEGMMQRSKGINNGGQG